jgi:hypothetical protein
MLLEAFDAEQLLADQLVIVPGRLGRFAFGGAEDRRVHLAFLPPLRRGVGAVWPSRS